jgi:methylated-DNA-protein-cysteine methyltransferase related protein
MPKTNAQRPKIAALPSRASSQDTGQDKGQGTDHGAIVASRKIVVVVRLIPRGFVASYSRIAARAGLPGRARLVARALKLADDTELPWHRVIRADGSVAVPGQQALLELEGVRFRGKRVEAQFIWQSSMQIETPEAVDQFLWQL